MTIENEKEIIRLCTALDLVESEILPCQRRTHEFKEIKDLLRKNIAVATDVNNIDETGSLICPRCECPIIYVSDDSEPFRIYCTNCGQLLEYGGDNK